MNYQLASELAQGGLPSDVKAQVRARPLDYFDALVWALDKLAKTHLELTESERKRGDLRDGLFDLKEELDDLFDACYC